MKRILYICIGLLLTFSSCQNDYLIDGGISSPYAYVTTVEYLKANPQKRFQNILTFYEKAGMLDLLNTPGATVFMPSDYSLNSYVLQIREQKREEYNDLNYAFTLDSLFAHIDEYKENLKMYIVPETINRDDVGSGREVKSLLGNDMYIYMQESPLYTGDSDNVPALPNSKPWFLYYRLIINGLDPSDEELEANDPNKDESSMCQTSGIITTTGILHTLEDYHKLFFNKMATPPRI